MTRIIIADAQELVCEGLRAWFSVRDDLRVEAHACTGTDLLHLVKSHPVDIAMLDVSLPGLDGIDTVRELRKRDRNIRILAHSALAGIEYVNSMLIEGANGYVVKGGPKQELFDAIDLVMHGGRYISPIARDSVAKGYAHCDKRMDGEYLGLSRREREIIVLIAREFSNDEIGAALHISTETVKTHRKNLMAKLNVRSVAGLVKYAQDRCWV